MSPRMTRHIVLTQGVLFLLLSAVHTVAIPFEHDRIRTLMPAALGNEYAFWFGAFGFYFALLGVVAVLASKKLGEAGSLAWPMAFVSSLFSAISGIFGVAMFGEGPPILVLVLGVVGLAALLKGRVGAVTPRSSSDSRDSSVRE